MSSSSRLVYKCTECNTKPYSRAQTLKNHYQNKHFTLININNANISNPVLADGTAVLAHTNDDVDKELYRCCACPSCYESLERLGEHVMAKHKDDIPPVKDCTNRVYKVTPEKKRVLEAIDMVPFDLQDENDKAIAYTLKENRHFLARNKGKRVKIDISEDINYTTECIHIKSASSIPIEQVVSKSPYKTLLAFDNYHEVSQEELEWMNTFWGDNFAHQLGVGQLLVGSIIVNEDQALLVNGTEVYGRDPEIDAYCEKTLAFKDSSVPTLLSQYANQLNVIKVESDNSQKLLVGTRACNFFIISRIRVDSGFFRAEVGASTKNFTPNRHTKLYISDHAKQQFVRTVNNASAIIPTTERLRHVRQLRTKHDTKSAYFLGRWFSQFTQATNLQPYSVYTLKSSPYSKQNSDNILGSKVLATVANAVVTCVGNSPQVSRKAMNELALGKETPGKNEKCLQQILELFEGDTLAVLNNTNLSDILAIIADNTTKYLKDPNAKIADNVYDHFQSSIDL